MSFQRGFTDDEFNGEDNGHDIDIEMGIIENNHAAPPDLDEDNEGAPHLFGPQDEVDEVILDNGHDIEMGIQEDDNAAHPGLADEEGIQEDDNAAHPGLADEEPVQAAAPPQDELGEGADEFRGFDVDEDPKEPNPGHVIIPIHVEPEPTSVINEQAPGIPLLAEPRREVVINIHAPRVQRPAARAHDRSMIYAIGFAVAVFLLYLTGHLFGFLWDSLEILRIILWRMIQFAFTVLKGRRH